jgi:hypothetical protein
MLLKIFKQTKNRNNYPVFSLFKTYPHPPLDTVLSSDRLKVDKLSLASLNKTKKQRAIVIAPSPLTIHPPQSPQTKKQTPPQTNNTQKKQNKKPRLSFTRESFSLFI